MTLLTTLVTLFFHLSIIWALTVPHPHPEESKIDIPIKLAAANTPESSDSGEVYDNYVRRDLLEKSDTSYIPEGGDSNNLLARDDDFFEGIDVDYLFWKRDITPGNENPSLGEFMSEGKNGENCVGQDGLEKNDEGNWKFKENEGPNGQVYYGYELIRDVNYGEVEEEAEKEYLRARYEGFSDNYLETRESYCRSGEGEWNFGLTGCESPDGAEDDYHWETEENRDNFSGDFNYPFEADEIQDWHTGVVGKSLSHHGNEDTEDLPNNKYLCETTEGSPTATDVIEMANRLIGLGTRQRCGSMNIFGSRCTKLGGIGSAQIAICALRPGWFVYCDNTGKYVLELTRRCKSEINGVWRVGGTIFHEDQMGWLIVY